MAAFKRGDSVRLKVEIPQGTVASMRMDEEGTVSYLMEWVDQYGDPQHRWFTEDQLEPV